MEIKTDGSSANCTKKDRVWKNQASAQYWLRRRDAADNWNGGFADIDWIKRRPTHHSMDLNRD